VSISKCHKRRITSKSWGCSVEKWRRLDVSKFLGPPALLARPFSLQYPSTLPISTQSHSKPAQIKSGEKRSSHRNRKMPQAQLKKSKTEKKTPAKPYVTILPPLTI